MAKVDIRDLKIELENAPDFKEAAKKYFDIVYKAGGMDFVLKPDIEIIYPEGPELLRSSSNVELNEVGLKLEFSKIEQLSPLGFQALPVPPEISKHLENYSFLIKGTNTPIGAGKELVKDMVIESERINRRIKFFFKKRDSKTKIILVEDGDSWHEHPLINDLVDALSLRSDLAISSLSRAGDELSRIVTAKEYVKEVKEEQPAYLMINGGGNDFLVDFGSFIKDFKGKTTPQKIDDYFNDLFKVKLSQIEGWYNQLVKEVIEKKGNIKIILHTYDYVIPILPKDTKPPQDIRDGDWVARPLRDKGVTNHTTQKQIVVKLMDLFHDLLMRVHGNYPKNVLVVDFRGQLPNITDWYDEIHPNETSNKKLANIISNLII